MYFPQPVLGADAPVPDGLADAAGVDDDREVRSEVVVVTSTLDAPPADAADAYLRLHLLSHRLVRPHGLNARRLFGVLANVVWTTAGPCAVDGFERVRTRLRARGPVTVLGVDKFPRMVDYVLPTGVRIADADRVRLGAHLAAGTTVMHEGFVQLQRRHARRVDGRGPDLRRASSSATARTSAAARRSWARCPAAAREVVRIGERCLLGANAGIGISLGDDCVVEAGLLRDGGSKVALPDGTVVKAAELSGRPALLFRRNSVSGALEALPRTGDVGRPQRRPARQRLSDPPVVARHRLLDTP